MKTSLFLLAPYVAADVEFTGRATFGDSKTVTVNTGEQDRPYCVRWHRRAADKLRYQRGEFRRSRRSSRVSILHPVMAQRWLVGWWYEAR